MGKKFVKGTPPDKGSFPIDHDNDCKFKQEEYLRCLDKQRYDNLACRYLAKEYLQCRMDHNLMAREPMNKLGFRDSDDKLRQPRKMRKHKKETLGFVPGEAEIIARQHEGWRVPNFMNFVKKQHRSD